MKNTLKNPEKADLDKDGKLTSYEEKRGEAIEEAMSNQAYLGGLLKAKNGEEIEVKEKPIPTIDDLPKNKALNEVPFIKMKDFMTGKDFILDTRPDRPEKKFKKPKKKRFGGLAIQGVKDPNKIHRS
jgi:hypothetical protein